MSLLLTLASPSGVLPIDLIQQKVGTTADASAGFTVSLDAPVTAGNSVIITLSKLSAAGFDIEPTFDGNGTNQAITHGDALNSVYVYYLHNVSGGTDCVTNLDLIGRCSVNISEWQGLANAVQEDSNVGNAVADANMITVPTVNPVSVNNLCIGISAYTNAVAAYSSGPNNGFTRMTQTGGASTFLECAYLIRTNDGSATSDATIVLSSGLDWSSCSTTFGGL